MWTPKRVFILVATFIGLLGVYYVYGLVFGRYDGLRPLPEEHLPSADRTGEDIAPPVSLESSIVQKLKIAFGPNCKEAHRPIHLELKNQGVFIAARYWRLLDNGNLGFDMVSVAIFGKPTPDGKPGEINTVRGVRAEIRFDQPLRSLRDANDKNRKAIGGRLEGGHDTEVKQKVPVHLRNNRRTGDGDDDLHLYTDWLEFLDEQHRIWTEAPVELVEGVRPNATVVTAKGMEVLLVANDPAVPPAGVAPATPAAKRVKPTVAGVKSVRLESRVRMDLLMDGKSAFMAGAKPADAPAKPADGTKPEKSRLIISSSGPFLYSIGGETDRAEFTDNVEVHRPHGPAPAADDQDELKCGHLVLLFKHKSADDKRRLDDKTGAMELLSVHAVGNPLELGSETKSTGGKPAESLRALGNELLFDKETNQTTLKGSPVEAVKDGHHLRLKGALILQNMQKDAKEPQEVRAIGPGEARLKSKDGNPNIIARWSEEFSSSKEGELDRILLTGKASFEDPERGTLRAEKLLVKLAAVAGDENAGDKKRRLPKYLEATENVSLTSPQLVISKTDRLRLDFDDPAVKPKEPAGVFARLGAQWSQPAPSMPSYLPGTNDGKKPPMVLAAKTVNAKLIRLDGRTELDFLEAEGVVKVSQEAGVATDPTGKAVVTSKEVRMDGESLKLVRAPEGYKLRVVGRGDPGKPQTYQPAFVQMDKLRLLGPSVEIDQPFNVVYIKGAGSMRMPSKSDFQGNPLEKPVDVTIDWNEEMMFDGRFAQFRGSVLAAQDISTLASEELYVELEQPISLKERKAGQADQPASLNRLMCHGKVCLEKKAKQGDKWREFQRIEGSQLLFEKANSELTVSGPGFAYVLQSGLKAAPMGPAEKPAPGAPALGNGNEPKLTRIEFSKQMKAGKAEDKATDTVEFTGTVRLVSIPTDQPDYPINEDKLPAGAIVLECKQLKAWSRKVDGKTVSNDFIATGEIKVKAKEAKGQDFSANADKASYDESKDLLILESPKSATIYRQKQQGGDFETVSARKISYWRKEGRIKTDQATDIGVKP